MSDNINSLSEAVKRARQVLESNTNEKVYHITYTNDAKHAIIETENKLQYYVLYKREFFHSFGMLFFRQDGWGESINEDFLRKAIDRDVASFIIVYAKGSVYCLSPREWEQYALANKTIRMTNEGEKTYSVPATLLRRWN